MKCTLELLNGWSSKRDAQEDNIISKRSQRLIVALVGYMRDVLSVAAPR